jgi:hypothetical protein
MQELGALLIFILLSLMFEFYTIMSWAIAKQILQYVYSNFRPVSSF